MVCGPVDCFRQFCDVAKSGDDLQGDLANFGYYKLNMKVKFVKHTSSSSFWLPLLEPCAEIWRFFLNFGQILAVENL
jgi:hypothetical protein